MIKKFFSLLGNERGCNAVMLFTQSGGELPPQRSVEQVFTVTMPVAVHDFFGFKLERLGPVVWESSVAKAAYALEELEETARLWLMSNPKPEPLDTQALQALEVAFGVRW